MKKITSTLALAAFCIPSTHAQSQNSNEEVYLHCVSSSDKSSVRDIHIDKKLKTLTDSFGTVKKYIEEGQFLVADYISDSEIGGKKVKLSTTKINTFNLEVTVLNYAIGTGDLLKCEKVEKKI